MFGDERASAKEISLFLAWLQGTGVSTPGESGETFPTRILTHEIYWGISPVKIRFRPDFDLFKFDVSLFCTQNLATPEK